MWKVQVHQFETGCTNLYTSNALEVYKFVHLIVKVRKFVNPMFAFSSQILTLLKNVVYKFVHTV